MNNEFFVVVDKTTGKYLRKTARGHGTWYEFNKDMERAWKSIWTEKIGEARIFASEAIANKGYNLENYAKHMVVDVEVQRYAAFKGFVEE